MTTDGDERIPGRFWRSAAGSAHRLLMLDFDGTLVELRDDPSEARLGVRSKALLEGISRSRRTTLAVVSGRPVPSLKCALDGVAAWLVGVHGWEWASPAGEVRCHPIPDRAAECLEDAARALESAGFGGALERKRGALGIQTRGVDRDRAEELHGRARRIWAAFDGPAGPLRLRSVKGGLEIRAAGRDKGTAVADLIAQAPDGAYPVYVGDDETDEDAFRAVQGSGFGIRVGEGEGASLASARLPSVAGVEAFLARWLREVEDLPTEDPAWGA